MNYIMSQYSLNDYEPIITEITLPSKHKIHIVTHDAKAAIYSLLNDPALMNEECLLLNFSNPCIPLDNDEYVGDLHTGELYKMGWKLYCKNDNDVLCALIFFIDKTHTDVLNKLPIEAVTMSLSIFNQKTRLETRSMRHIGYVTNQDHIKYKKAEHKIEDYHYILNYIFSNIKKNTRK